MGGNGGDLSSSRRAFLRNVAALGGAVWVAPAVVSISSARGQVMSPVPGCACNGSATALFASGTALGLPVSIGPVASTSGPEVCVASVGGPGSLISASTLCGRTGSTPTTCSASSDVQSIDIPSIGVSATGVHSSVTEPCDCSPATGTATIATLSTPGGNFTGLAPAPNTVLLNAGGITIIANQQGCIGNQHFVRALVITVSQPLLANNFTVVVAESRTQANNCTCP